jgi:hypothetical protein
VVLKEILVLQVTLEQEVYRVNRGSKVTPVLWDIPVPWEILVLKGNKVQEEQMVFRGNRVIQVP